jgi:hypothetical protein
MLPISLSCKIKAYPSELGWDVYDRAINLCAGRNVRTTAIGNFRTWYEHSSMTFGSAAWYQNLSSLTLTSLLAIGVAGRRAGTRESYVAAISAFSSVSTNLLATLARTVNRVAQKEVTPLPIRAKLGQFVQDDDVRGIVGRELLSMEFLTKERNRLIFHKDAGPTKTQAPSLWPSRSLLELDVENTTPTTPEVPWRETAGLIAVGLELSKGSVLVTRDLSVELLDVTTDIEEVASTLSDLITILDPYLETES